ncbi:MAG TPA: hydroxyacid dehydrogenase [Acidimicrobiaceae bacterium]|jgi:phosphoglycerate dehydrogenase-like enzyme|nr:hydroxyacid dehydrogenase [Actinomycetota bacterium]HAN08934.1 hydroxyacid dehydrogenase [Acidimicrobiaceae bacterium]
MTSLNVAVEPACWRQQSLAEAVLSGGGLITKPSEAQALVWAEPSRADLLPKTLDENPGIQWVQLPYAGIEPFLPMLQSRPNLIWTCGKGVYAEPVAEHALALTLAGLRKLHIYGKAKQWGKPQGKNLYGARVTILGGGGITEFLLKYLQPFKCRITVIRKNIRPMPGSSDVTSLAKLHQELPETDVLILALALTPETEGIIGATELSLLPSHAWVINVARGKHVVTDDLVEALVAESIGGAALDVTDPEPLDPNHLLWTLDNCIITPHVGNTPEMGLPLLAERVTQNVRARVNGDQLIGLVDTKAGY